MISWLYNNKYSTLYLELNTHDIDIMTLIVSELVIFFNQLCCSKIEIKNVICTNDIFTQELSVLYVISCFISDTL